MSWTKWMIAAFLSFLIALPAGAAVSPAAKPVPEWKPKAGESWLEVIKKERRLYLWQGEKILKTYRVAIGSGKGIKQSPIDKITPVGTFSIRRVADTSKWIFDPKVFNEPGEPQKDVYGKLAISFRNPWNLAIHGTNAPWSIGHAVTHGCIRMKNQDIEELAKHVKPGMKLVIREKTLAADRVKRKLQEANGAIPAQEKPPTQASLSPENAPASPDVVFSSPPAGISGDLLNAPASEDQQQTTSEDLASSQT